jgi:hypothetical protein
MSELGLNHRCPKPKVLLIRNSGERGCCWPILLGALALAAGLWSSPARADSAKEGGPPTRRELARRRQRASATSPERDQETHPLGIELLVHAYLGDVGIGMIGLGLEASYRPWPHFGFGAQLDTFGVDNGEYPPNGSILHGTQLLTFAEADLLTGWFTPYLRFGLGVASYDRMVVPPGYFDDAGHIDTSPAPTAQASVGIALHGGPFLLRISASPTLIDNRWVAAYYAGAGVRF